MEELLRRLGISSNQSAEAIADALGAKQMEHLERLDNVEDEARREELKRELKQIEEAIANVSKGEWQSVTGMKRDIVEDSFDDLKQQPTTEEREVLQTGERDYVVREEYEKVKEIYDSDIKIGFSQMLELANRGNVYAQMEVAFYYDFEEGGERDLAKAIEWYQKAAEQGHPTAEFNLAQYYYNGEGIEENKETAVKYYRRSAMKDYVSAQLRLGWLYLEGVGGLEKSKEKAIEWWKKAAYQKDFEAIKLLSHFGVRP